MAGPLRPTSRTNRRSDLEIVVVVVVAIEYSHDYDHDSDNEQTGERRMQIDFHHGVTYVVARLAGFGHRDAEIVAYCSRYVDDATNDGVVRFENGAMYRRTASAHKSLDYKHFDELGNPHVWLPFHFLPGNGGKRAGENPAGSFIEKIICTPDSPVARDMVRARICDRDREHRSQGPAPGHQPSSSRSTSHQGITRTPVRC
jgi:hypothetical protein